MLSQVSSEGCLIFFIHFFLFLLSSFSPPVFPHFLYQGLSPLIFFLVTDIWSAWPCLEILWLVMSRPLWHDLVVLYDCVLGTLELLQLGGGVQLVQLDGRGARGELLVPQ